MIVNQEKNCEILKVAWKLAIILASYILARMAFKLEIGFFARNAFSARIDFLASLARNSFSARNGFSTRNGFSAFGQKWQFGRNCVSAKNTFVKFEVAFWQEMAFFKWICLTSQSIERFGSPLMAESFQACWIKIYIQLTLVFKTSSLKSRYGLWQTAIHPPKSQRVPRVLIHWDKWNVFFI